VSRRYRAPTDGTGQILLVELFQIIGQYVADDWIVSTRVDGGGYLREVRWSDPGGQCGVQQPGAGCRC
jgi:hypothetical protein